MKALIGCLTLFFVAGAATGDAAWFGFLKKRRCLPRAIDSPIVRPKVKEYHKPGNHMKHPGECSLRLAPPPTANV
jgi:hypothetical protein